MTMAGAIFPWSAISLTIIGRNFSSWYLSSWIYTKYYIIDNDLNHSEQRAWKPSQFLVFLSPKTSKAFAKHVINVFKDFRSCLVLHVHFHQLIEQLKPFLDKRIKQNVLNNNHSQQKLCDWMWLQIQNQLWTGVSNHVFEYFMRVARN